MVKLIISIPMVIKLLVGQTMEKVIRTTLIQMEF